MFQMDGFTSPYDLSGLQGQIASGEGFDWYYKSADNRALRTRTPITDGAGSLGSIATRLSPPVEKQTL